MRVSFVVPGQPVPKGRPRYDGRGRRFHTPQRTIDYEKHVRTLALVAMRGDEPTDEPVEVMIACYRKDRRRVDADNLGKSITDAINGVVFEDDSQIRKLTIEKHYDKENPRAVVEVRG